MDNSKDVSQWLKFLKKFLGWGLFALTILVLAHLIYIYNFQGYGPYPHAQAQSSLRNLLTVLEAYQADHQKYPQTNESLSFKPDDGVTASFVTSSDGQHYFAVAFHREGNCYYFAFSESSLIWSLRSPKEGLVTAMPL